MRIYKLTKHFENIVDYRNRIIVANDRIEILYMNDVILSYHVAGRFEETVVDAQVDI